MHQMATYSSPEIVEIGVLEYPGAMASAAATFTDLFAVANRLVAADRSQRSRRIRLTRWIMSPREPLVRRVMDGGIITHGRPTIMTLPPCMSGMHESRSNDELLEWLRDSHEGGSVFAACGAGSLLLARAGLLSGRCVSASGRYAELILSSSPEAWMQPEREIIDDGDIITASGRTAWVNIGLRLIERVLGNAVMAAVAQHQMIELPPRARQDLCRFMPVFSHGDRAVLRAQRWLHSNGARHVTLNDISQVAGLEPRTLQRRFLKNTGLRPIEYCQNLRIAKAQHLFHAGSGVDEVAWAVGYSDQSAFRRLFLRQVGMTPAAFRRFIGKHGVSMPLPVQVRHAQDAAPAMATEAA